MGYILVNPRLSNSSIKSSKKNLTDAADEIWSQLSSNIKNYTPKFYFTVQNTSDSKLSHYVVKEGIESDRVKYNLKQYKSKKIDEKTFLNELKQSGGKHHKHHKSDDDSSSSSSSSSEEMVFTFPAGKTHKDLLTLTYYPTIYGVPNVIYPTFSTAFTPFTNIKLLPNMVVLNPNMVVLNP
jgi:hypothetical protein